MANDTYGEILSKWEIKKIIESSSYDDAFGEYELPNKLGLLDRFPKGTEEKILLMVIRMNTLIIIFVKASCSYWYGMRDP